jgi:hypothetical protein
VQQESRHAEEDRRQDAAQQVLFADLVVEHGMRDLLEAAVRRNAAEGGELARGLLDDGGAGGIGRQPERGVGPGAFHVHRGGKLLLVDPEHAERAQVGHAPEPREDVLRRKRGARDAQRPQLAVHERRDGIARPQAASAGEPLGHQRLEFAGGTAARLRPAAGPDAHEIELLRAAQVDADQVADDRLGRLCEAHACAGLHRGLHREHPGQGGEPGADAVGRAFHAGEHVGEAPAFVEGVACAGQRLHRRQARDESGDAARDDQRDRHCLAPQEPQVAPCLAVDRLHGLTTTVPRA